MPPHHVGRDTVLKINEIVYYEDRAADTIMTGVITGYEAGHYLVRVPALPEHGINEEMIIWREREDLLSIDQWEEWGREAWSWQLERR